MGQVIKVNFTAQTSTATPNTADQSPISEQAVVPLRANSTELSDTPEIMQAVSPKASNSGAQTATPLATTNPAAGNSLVDACARMRADTAALREAVRNLRRATADLDRLPAMARELCEAAI